MNTATDNTGRTADSADHRDSLTAIGFNQVDGCEDRSLVVVECDTSKAQGRAHHILTSSAAQMVAREFAKKAGVTQPAISTHGSSAVYPVDTKGNRLAVDSATPAAAYRRDIRIASGDIMDEQRI